MDPTVTAPPTESRELSSPSTATFHTTSDEIASADHKAAAAAAAVVGFTARCHDVADVLHRSGRTWLG